MPELPAAKRRRYTDELGLSGYDAAVLVGDAGATELFEAARAADADLSPKKLANWISGEYLRLAKGEAGAAVNEHVSGAELAALVRLVEDGEISGTNAKEVFARHAQTGQPIATIVAAAGFRQISDQGALRTAVDEVIAENPDAVADIRAGKQQAIGFLTGQVMKKTRGQANAAVVRDLLQSTLEGA